MCPRTVVGFQVHCGKEGARGRESRAEQEGSVGERDSLTTDAKPLQQPQIKRPIKKERGGRLGSATADWPAGRSASTFQQCEGNKNDEKTNAQQSRSKYLLMSYTKSSR